MGKNCEGTKISLLPEYTTDPSAGYVPIEIAGTTYKVLASLFGGTGSGCCSLQDTTDVGNTTTNDVYIANVFITDPTGSAITDPAASLSTVTNGITSGGLLALKDFNSSEFLQLQPNTAITYTGGIRTLLFPDNDGVIPVSVNGVFADAFGNIDTTGGGGGTTPDLQEVTDVGKITTHNIQIAASGTTTDTDYAGIELFNTLADQHWFLVSNNLGDFSLVNQGLGNPAFYAQFSGQIGFLNYGGGTYTGTPTFALAVDAGGNIIEVATGGGGGGGSSITADNGLNMSSSTNVQLGGPLTTSTTIDAGNFNLNITSTNDADQSVSIVNSSGTAIALYVQSTVSGGGSSGIAIYADAESGYGIFSNTTDGISGNFTTETGMPLIAELAFSTTNDVQPIMELKRRANAVPAVGIGQSIDYYQFTNGQYRLGNQLISKVTTIATTPTTEFSITGVNVGVTTILLQLTGAGLMILAQGAPSFSNNAAAISGGLVAGTLYRNGDVLQIVH